MFFFVSKDLSTYVEEAIARITNDGKQDKQRKKAIKELDEGRSRKYPVSIDYKHFWMVYNSRIKQRLSKHGTKKSYQLLVHAIELRNSYEKALLAMVNLLPLTAAEIKAVGFREFYRNLVRSKQEAKRLEKARRQSEAAKKTRNNKKRRVKNG